MPSKSENHDEGEKETKLSDYSIYDKEEERRKLRADYRYLNQCIEENAEEIIQPSSTKISESIIIGEELFSKVRRPREAVHDSAYLLLIAKKSREQAQELKTDVVCFDNATFAQKLIGNIGGYQLTSTDNVEDVDLPIKAWEKLEKKASSLFKSSPCFEFLLGPLILEVVIREKNARQPRKKDVEGVVKKLQQVFLITDSLNPNLRNHLFTITTTEKQEEATTKEVDRIYKVLKKGTQGGKEPVCFFKFVINPESFGQTVENIFHTAFLIKDGRVVIDFDDDELPTINLHKIYQEEEHEQEIPRKQVVMPITVKDWQDLIEVYEIKEPMIPTRASIIR